MSDNYTEDQDFDLDESAEASEPAQDKSNDRKWVRDLEKRAKAADQAKAEAEAAKRELAFLKAGINLDTPQGKLFAKAYDGEFSAEAVKAAAEEYGVIQAAEQQIPKEELDAMDRMSRATATPASSSLDDPIALLNNAETPDQIIEILKKNGIVIDNEQPGQWRSLV